MLLVTPLPLLVAGWRSWRSPISPQVQHAYLAAVHGYPAAAASPGIEHERVCYKVHFDPIAYSLPGYLCGHLPCCSSAWSHGARLVPSCGWPGSIPYLSLAWSRSPADNRLSGCCTKRSGPLPSGLRLPQASERFTRCCRIRAIVNRVPEAELLIMDCFAQFEP